MAKGILDKNASCSVVVANQSVSYEGNFTQFEYKEVCVPTGKTTPLTLYKASIWILVLFSLYALVYLNYYIWVEKLLKYWGFIK